jgi:hypothetical protein
MGLKTALEYAEAHSDLERVALIAMVSRYQMALSAIEILADLNSSIYDITTAALEDKDTII